MFAFPIIGSLPGPQVNEALMVPAVDEGVEWSNAALMRVIQVTERYPYFPSSSESKVGMLPSFPPSSLPTMLREAFQLPPRNSTMDSSGLGLAEPAIRSVHIFGQWLNWEPVLCPQAKSLPSRNGRQRRSVPIRDGLIKKALCYSPRWGEIDFTVPMFDEFMKRWIPDLRSVSR
jgi:hypothetical protein